ncbi:hypothetical protein CCACVL1_12501 [Corchorus capsularis]|uniref:Uncharacterized protein n=1 Tax=Corchorus capsularis TaxID=210143 RepID=A0A1R3IFB8_COCAP|nr:hypothetical protein CCACVL1_12501 [Corchorus capsularis]
MERSSRLIPLLTTPGVGGDTASNDGVRYESTLKNSATKNPSQTAEPKKENYNEETHQEDSMALLHQPLSISFMMVPEQIKSSYLLHSSLN